MYFKLRVQLCIVSILVIGDAKIVDRSSYRSNVHRVQKWSEDRSLGYAVRNANSASRLYSTSTISKHSTIQAPDSLYRRLEKLVLPFIFDSLSSLMM